MTATTAPAAQAVQRCRGRCKQVRSLFDFYSMGAYDPAPRSVCKACWQVVNAKAHQRRQRRRALLSLLKNSQRPT